MKLLDLMIKDKVHWPDGADFAEQCPVKAVHFYKHTGQGNDYLSSHLLPEMDGRGPFNRVSRAQYHEALPAPVACRAKTLEQLVQEAADLKVSARRWTEKAMVDVTSYNKIMSEINALLSGTGWVITPTKGDE